MTDQVTIQPDGKWELNIKKENNSRSSGVASPSDDDDDDLVEITKSGDSVKMGTPRAYGTPVGSVGPGSVPPSGVPRGAQSSGSTKRPRTEVIDLCSSEDEDDEPLARPAAKRQQTNGYNGPSPPVYRPHTNGY